MCIICEFLNRRGIYIDFHLFQRREVSWLMYINRLKMKHEDAFNFFYNVSFIIFCIWFVTYKLHVNFIGGEFSKGSFRKFDEVSLMFSIFYMSKFAFNSPLKVLKFVPLVCLWTNRFIFIWVIFFCCLILHIRCIQPDLSGAIFEITVRISQRSVLLQQCLKFYITGYSMLYVLA